MKLDELPMYDRANTLQSIAEGTDHKFTGAKDVLVRVVKGEVSVFIEGHKIFLAETRSPIRVELGTL